MSAPRFFNTAGPVNFQDHYCLPPLARINLSLVLPLIAQKKYFVLHAPRQTGKTSCLLALMDHLNRADTYRCLYVNLESAQAAREDVERGMRAILSELGESAERFLNDASLHEIGRRALSDSGEYVALNVTLSRWAEASIRPVVLLVDEIDALVGDTLISVLRQLRTGYANRPDHFPQSVVVCGVRDVRDYRIHSGRDKSIITGGSAFNVKAESLRLGDFTGADIVTLYLQHTEETHQTFEPAALERVEELTNGQPWLVNALGYETCFRMQPGLDRSNPITAAMITQAKENLIERRETHLDQLADKLREERVRRVIEPILTSRIAPTDLPENDVDYVYDLGLIQKLPQLHIANPIYQEIIPRALTYTTQLTISQEATWYLAPDGRLDMAKLMRAFQEFFREHSEHWVERFDYKEAGPQLLMQAFLQRVVNGGGRIDREYGLGRGRTDLLVTWPRDQKIVIELKILRGTLERTIEEGLAQTYTYMDRCGADEGHLVIFDRDPRKDWADKLFRRASTVHGAVITVWGM